MYNKYENNSIVSEPTHPPGHCACACVKEPKEALGSSLLLGAFAYWPPGWGECRVVMGTSMT